MNKSILVLLILNIFIWGLLFIYNLDHQEHFSIITEQAKHITMEVKP